MKPCKYYNERMDKLIGQFEELYKIEGCGAGGLLHVLLDDFNYGLYTIEYCHNECMKYMGERKEALLGVLICMELAEMSTEERAVLFALWEGRHVECVQGCPDKCVCELLDDGLYEDIVELDKRYRLKFNEVKNE